MEFPWINGHFLGIKWHFWKLIGWVGNAAFFSRFLIQWYATEKHKRVVVPVSFWWLSLVGSLFLLTYALFYQQDSVFIFAYAFNWIPYLRNLLIHQRSLEVVACPACAAQSSASANYCSSCGAGIRAQNSVAARGATKGG